MTQEPETQLFRSVVYRALYDALGFTSVSRNSDAHLEIVTEARNWFLNPDTTDFDFVCDMAQLDRRKIKQSSIKLIEARQSGNYSRIPAFWRDCFKRNRAPSFGALEKDLDVYIVKM